MPTSGPIFITGPDRSGTTLLYALFASHPDISMVRRSNMWRWFYGNYGDLRDAAALDRCLSDLLRYQRLQPLEPDEARIRQEFAAGPQTYGRLFALFHEHLAERRGTPRWGDKSLHTEYDADAIFEAHPDARMLHLVRDPRDRYASVVRRRGPGEAKGIIAATGRWLASMRAARRNVRRYPDRYMIVRYETLATMPESTTQAVCRFIDAPYDPVMLTMSGAPDHDAVGGNSSFEAIEPGVISTRSIGRYRAILDPADIAFIQTCARPSMLRHGYEIERLPGSTGDRARRYGPDFALRVIRLAGWFAVDAWQSQRGTAVPDERLTPVAS